MLSRWRPFLRVLLLTALYLLGAAISLHLVSKPGAVAVFWPASGLAFALVLHFGLRWWLFILAANLLMHVLLDPVPIGLIPFSALSNAIGALLGATWVRMRGKGPYLGVAFGLSVLEGGVLMGIISGSIGALGLYVVGWSGSDAILGDALLWGLGDVLSVNAITPLVMMWLARGRQRPIDPRAQDFAGMHERIAWALLFAIAIAAIVLGGPLESAFSFGLTAVPFALLLWSAMRMPPIWTAAGVAVMVLSLTIASVAGVGGLLAPHTTGEIVLYQLFMSLLAIAPLLLAVGTYERRIADSALLRRAMRDPLTGLPNRTAFEDAVRAVLGDAQVPAFGGRRTFAFAYLDLDHFALVNDTASHQAGDALIKGVASLLSARLTAPHRVFRIGGDEFALLLSGSSEATARALVEDVLAGIERYRLAWYGLVLNTTASAGLVVFSEQGSSYAALLAQADAACFTAKEMGGNRLCVASTSSGEMRSRTEAMRWAVRIRSSLHERRFELYCQSIVPVHAGLSSGRHFETLLRLNSGGTLLMPGDFVPAAERFRLGVQLDRHVIMLVLEWFDAHPDALEDVDTCAINLTAGALVDEGFAGWLEDQLRGTKMPPRQLCFEITETSAVHDLARARVFIERLRALGCRFALDDFGTGFSSFAYLRSLDVDYIKIDGSFVRDLDASPMSKAVVRSIIDIAHVLEKATIAEHAETVAVCAALRELGVDYLQGYALHMPEPIASYFAYEPRGSAPTRRAPGLP